MATSAVTRALAVAVVASTGVPGTLVSTLREALVVGTEVEAPVGDAVRLVDHDEPGAGHERADATGEARVGEPFGRHEQHVDGAGLDGGEHVGPLADVGGVDRDRVQPAAFGGGDLVAHERQQRRHHERRSAAERSDRRGRRPVDGRLAPAGGLHDEDAGLVGDERLDRGELVGVRGGSLPRHGCEH